MYFMLILDRQRERERDRRIDTEVKSQIDGHRDRRTEILQI